MTQLHYTMHSDLSSFLVLITLMLPGLTFWCVLICFSCVPLVCNLMDCSSPGSSVHGIFQARILEWVAISFFRASSWPWILTQVSCIGSRFFTNWANKEGLEILVVDISRSIYLHELPFGWHVILKTWLHETAYWLMLGMCVQASWVTSVMSNSLGPFALLPTRLLCPWDSPGKNTAVGHHTLLHGIFTIQD